MNIVYIIYNMEIRVHRYRKLYVYTTIPLIVYTINIIATYNNSIFLIRFIIIIKSSHQFFFWIPTLTIES